MIFTFTIAHILFLMVLYVYLILLLSKRMLFSASFSDGSGGSEISSGSREILVQHLLVKEDDVKLFVELRNRILQGLS